MAIGARDGAAPVVRLGCATGSCAGPPPSAAGIGAAGSATSSTIGLLGRQMKAIGLSTPNTGTAASPQTVEIGWRRYNAISYAAKRFAPYRASSIAHPTVLPKIAKIPV